MTQDSLSVGGEDQFTIDPNTDYLQELVGENKKFKDVQSLAKGKAESDAYIKMMERRLDESNNDYLNLKGEYQAKASLAELLDQYKNQRTQNDDINPPVIDVNERQPNSIDPKQIESLVSSKIQEHEMTRKHQENFELVRRKAEEHYGPDYKRILNQQVNDLGMTPEQLDNLARTTPTAAIRALGLEVQTREDFQPPVRSNQRSSFTPKGTEKRTWTWYQNLKRTNPELYKDSKTTVQMHKDAIALGDEFADGDF